MPASKPASTRSGRYREDHTQATRNLWSHRSFMYTIPISSFDIKVEEPEVAKRNQKVDLLRGTLDLLILRTLELRPLHGVAVAERIRQVTNGTFVVQAGSLFPALHRLEQEGWIAGAWSTTEHDRRVKSYALTTEGRRQLGAEKRQWERIVAAMARVLDETS